MCDARLHELMCYIKSTLSDRMIGFIGDDPSELSLHIFCDAASYLNEKVKTNGSVEATNLTKNCSMHIE